MKLVLGEYKTYLHEYSQYPLVSYRTGQPACGTAQQNPSAHTMHHAPSKLEHAANTTDGTGLNAHVRPYPDGSMQRLPVTPSTW